VTLLDAAVRNNAAWCAAVVASHGRRSTWTDGLWACAERSPPLFPDAVTLSPTTTEADVVEAIDVTSPGASVKDSFARLDLRDAGFTVLFDAEWIHLEPGRHDGGGVCGDPWEAIDAASLPGWVRSWDGGGTGLFLPGLLTQPGVRLLAAGPLQRPTAGAAVQADAEVLGVSNLFARDHDLPTAWRGCLALLAPEGWPVVGYETGHDLAAARSVGARPLGPLRIWIARVPR